MQAEQVNRRSAAAEALDLNRRGRTARGGLPAAPYPDRWDDEGSREAR